MPYNTGASSLANQFDPYQYMMQMQGLQADRGLNGVPGALSANGGVAAMQQAQMPMGNPVQPAPVPGSYPMGPGTPEPTAAGGMNPMTMMMAMQALKGLGGGGGQPQMQAPPPVMPQGPGPTVQAPGGNPEPMQRAMAALQRLQEMRRGAGQQQAPRLPMPGGM